MPVARPQLLAPQRQRSLARRSSKLPLLPGPSSEVLLVARPKLRLPVLLISGGRSDVVSDHTIAEFQRLVPHATHERIDHATHMVVGDANDLFIHTISNYLQQIAARPS